MMNIVFRPVERWLHILLEYCFCVGRNVMKAKAIFNAPDKECPEEETLLPVFAIPISPGDHEATEATMFCICPVTNLLRHSVLQGLADISGLIKLLKSSILVTK
jgi:hypothetical protein